METTTPQTDIPPAPTSSTEQQQSEMKLVDVPVDSTQTALNLLVSFINLAHKRGAFSIDEASKIWDCIKTFQQQPPPQP